VPRPNRVIESRLTFVWTNDWSFTELLQRCATMPAHSAIFYGVLALDANGVPQIEEHTLRELHAVANAPIFGLHSTQLGRGIVGGPLLSIEDLSRNTANVALRLLQGESPRSIVTPTQVAGVPAFDWRELERWGIGEDLSNDVALAVFRVLQEALANAMTHSASCHVSVSLDGNEDEIRLEVSDDGVGFDPDAAMKGHGVGLIAMRERLRAVGGDCAITSRCGAGTRILARVPIRRRDRTAP
jgi:signal transduction histidine kinase